METATASTACPVGKGYRATPFGVKGYGETLPALCQTAKFARQSRLQPVVAFGHINPLVCKLALYLADIGALTKPASAKIALIKEEISGNFRFLRRL